MRLRQRSKWENFGGSMIVFALAVSPLLGGSVRAGETQKEAAEGMRRDLDSASEVRLYFLRSTDGPDYTVAQFVQQAGIQIMRQCGANCARYMHQVIQHFQNATPRPCIAGDQNVVIIIPGGEPIVYSINGRHIRYRGHCYFNKQMVNDILEQREFVFFGFVQK